MLDQNLRQAISQKIQDGEFGARDIPEYLAVLCQTGNESPDVQEEVKGWDRRIVFDLEGLGAYWVTVLGGTFTTGPGALAAPDLTLGMAGTAAAGIFSGDKDAKAAYMSGALKVEGALPDAVKIQTLIQIVLEELE